MNIKGGRTRSGILVGCGTRGTLVLLTLDQMMPPGAQNSLQAITASTIWTGCLCVGRDSMRLKVSKGETEQGCEMYVHDRLRRVSGCPREMRSARGDIETHASRANTHTRGQGHLVTCRLSTEQSLPSRPIPWELLNCFCEENEEKKKISMQPCRPGAR